MKTVWVVGQLLLIASLCGESLTAQDLYKLNQFIQTQGTENEINLIETRTEGGAEYCSH